ncbi:hypothetical protein QBC36DRAFT_332212 [Triangularia setosa]|uniref:Secreted protein n=1 Tax=Triangularia setosa TaxID=2587417 RepID=A0AAN7A5R2_9PEZI|nr:hypothetical protein QBC36DRAFT_332212 [Podospora setosa]
MLACLWLDLHLHWECAVGAILPWDAGPGLSSPKVLLLFPRSEISSDPPVSNFTCRRFFNCRSCLRRSFRPREQLYFLRNTLVEPLICLLNRTPA